MNKIEFITSHDAFPHNFNLEERIKILRVQLAFLLENQWLKENSFITRYKGRRSMSDLSGTSYEKIVFSIVKSIVSETFSSLQFRVTKNGAKRCVVELNLTDMSRSEANIFRRLLDTSEAFYQAVGTLFGSPTRSDFGLITRSGYFEFQIRYFNLMLLDTGTDMTLQRLKENLESFRDLFVSLKEQAIAEASALEPDLPF